MKTRVIILLAFIWSCEPVEDCQLDPNSDSFYIGFNHSTLTEVTFDSVKNDVVSTIFFDMDSSFNSVQLPISEELADITYTFFTDSIDYFLTVQYEGQINLYGDDCPPSVFFSALEIVSHNFDSAAVTNPELDRRLFENIEVFF